MKNVVRLLVFSLLLMAGLLVIQENKTYANESNIATQEETLVVKEQKYGVMIGDTDNEGKYYYSDTFEQHLAKIEECKIH